MPSKRTEQQNSALHLYCRWAANALNDAGYPVQKALSKAVEIPWTEHSFKELVWREIQKHMTGRDSTTDCITTDYAAIEEVIARWMAERLNVPPPPWPSQETLALEEQGRYGCD